MSFKIAGFLIVLVVEVVVHLAYRRADKIGDAVGHFGRKVVDGIGEDLK